MSATAPDLPFSPSAAASPIAPSVPRSRDAIAIVARGVVVEAARRKDFYVLLSLMVAYLCAAAIFALVGIKSEAAARLVYNLGLSFTWGCAHVLTLLTMARQAPDDIENRTIHPMLAKPLGRTDYLLGKWFACTAVGVLSLLVFHAMTGVGWLLIARGSGLSGGLLAQCVTLHAFSVAALAAVTLAGSIQFARPVNMILCGLILFGGGKLAGFALARSRGGGLEEVVGWFARYVPDFQKFDLVSRYTDGIGPLAGGEFASLILVALLLTGGALAAADALFARRPL